MNIGANWGIKGTKTLEAPLHSMHFSIASSYTFTSITVTFLIVSQKLKNQNHVKVEFMAELLYWTQCRSHVV